MIKLLISHLSALPHWQNVALSITLLLLGLTLILWVCAWVFKDDGYKVENLPTEDQLRKRDNDGAHRAFLKYTSRKVKP